MVLSYQSNTGIRFGLDPELWERWWLAIPQADRDSFRFHDGDVALSKFVCAFDYITHRGKDARAPRISTIVFAYAAAYGEDPNSHLSRVRAAEKYEHPAVQFLLDQFEYRNVRATVARLEPSWSALAEKMIEDALKPDTSMKDRATAFNAVAKVFGIVSRENIADRNIRSKASVKNAEKIVFEDGEQNQSISDSQLTEHMAALVGTFGEDKIREALTVTQSDSKAKRDDSVIDILDDE